MDREKQHRGFEVSENAVNVGYFRDCYNSGGLFAVMNQLLGCKLSWWQTVERDDLFETDTDGEQYMSVEGAKKWLAEIEPLLIQFQQLPAFRKENDPVDSARYRKWAGLLLQFLRLAIEKESPILFSV